jgi:hypothetical protein
LLYGSTATAATAPPSSESLDRELLEGLDASLLDGLEIPTVPGNTENNDSPNGLPAERSTTDPAAGEDTLRLPKNLDRQLFKKWSDQTGEDLGQPSRQSPLVGIESAMRTAEELIADRASVEQGLEVQQQVVADLDALIEELQKQCAACQGQSSSQTQKPSSRRSEVASKPGRPAGSKGTTAAEDSTTRLNQGAAAAVDMAEMQELLKDLWGHLPERVREQLLQAPTDEFLPKYELEIEKYFRRLAEEGRQDELRP